MTEQTLLTEEEVNGLEMQNKQRHRRQRGATLVEYALLIALIGVGAMGAMRALRQDIGDGMDRVGNVVSRGR